MSNYTEIREVVVKDGISGNTFKLPVTSDGSDSLKAGGLSGKKLVVNGDGSTYVEYTSRDSAGITVKVGCNTPEYVKMFNQYVQNGGTLDGGTLQIFYTNGLSVALTSIIIVTMLELKTQGSIDIEFQGTQQI